MGCVGGLGALATLTDCDPTQGDVEAVSMARGLNIGCGCPFAEHLQDGIARDQVDEYEDYGNHQPDHGNGIQQATREVAQHACSLCGGPEPQKSVFNLPLC